MAPARRKAAPPVSPQQVFAATLAGRISKTKEDIFASPAADDEMRSRRDPRDRGSIEHTTSAKVTMWKPNPPHGYIPREIPVENIKMAFGDGWLSACPDCGTTDCTDDPNSCTGRAPMKYRSCPECNKRVYDVATSTLDIIAEDPEAAEESESDPHAIVDDSYLASTPEARTKSRLDRHMLAYHPEEAAARGLFAQTPRDPTEQGNRRN